MNMIDTHAHLYLPEFKQDITGIIERAQQSGVQKIFLPAINSEVIEDMLALEKDFPGICFSMMGLHPCYVKENYLDELKVVENWLSARKFAAVGEIGLDFYWDRNFDQQQIAAFHRQIELAQQYNLPIVIHSRNSTQECIDIVKQYRDGSLRGIFHCFSGDFNQAAEIIECGFYLGIGGVLTYKNSGLAAVLENISLEHMVLETDAPYLTPVPFRGKRNESSYLKYVLARLSTLKGLSENEVSAITTVNAEKIFGS
jgi:TatD DNase family protein